MPARTQNKLISNLIILWFPVLVFMGLIFHISSFPGSEIPSVFPFQDILFHFFVYLMLAFFFSRAMQRTYPNITTAKIILVTLIFGTFYGLTDEFHQAFVPLRSCSGLDLLIDSLGSIAGSLVFIFRKKLFLIR